MSDWIVPPSSSIADAAPAPEPVHAEPPQPPRFAKPPKPPKPPRGPGGGPGAARIWGIVLGVVALVIVCGALAANLAVRNFLAEVPDIPAKSELLVANQAPGMTFEDRTGKVIATRGPKHGFPVTLGDLPAYVPQAFLAAEDRRFYHHGAIDPQGIVRAAWANWRAHHTVQGGSTLTQQLAKTLYLSPNQTLKRKLQEAVIARRMEQEMSKDEVLELYLNRIFFGDNAYGIDAAAQTYFGKPAKALDLQEAALLAALPKAPTRLALTNDMEAAVARSHRVLENMRAEKWITEDQLREALENAPKLAPEAPGEGEYGYVLDMAAAQAVKLAGDSAPDLVVRLSIDPKLQAASQQVVAETIAADGKRANVHQGALVLLAPDGAIRALVGGTSHRASAFNRAIQAERQPGSSFKPFVYAAALEAGVKPTDIRQDAPVRFGPWAPTNYEGGYSGAVTVADALAHSINTVAVRLADEVGGARIGEIAHRFGFKTIPDVPNLSVALGAYEVNLLELTGAFQVFQQAGQRTEPYLIEEIDTSRGDSLYSHAVTLPASVYDSANAGQMVRMMEGVLAHGTGTRAAFGRPAAGKTGTTQNWRDAWFVGFTPDWVCGVWVGNDDDQPMNHITGGQIPAEIWRRVMITAHDGVPSHDFNWLPPEEIPTPPTITPVDAPTDPTTVTKGAFYDGLTNDFDRTAKDPAAPQPADDPADAAPPPKSVAGDAPAKPALTPATPKPAPKPTNGDGDGDISGDPRP